MIQLHPRSLLVGLGVATLLLAAALESCRSAEPTPTPAPADAALHPQAPEVVAVQPMPLAQAGVVRIVLTPNTTSTGADIRVGSEAYASVADLEAALQREQDAAKLAGGAIAVMLAANHEVSWSVVMQVVNACKRVGITAVDFELG